MSIKEKMLRILALALEINNPEVDAIGKKKTAVFVEWYPHCNCYEIMIHSGGWVEDVIGEEDIRAYTDRDNADETLDAIISHLESILAEEGEQNV